VDFSRSATLERRPLDLTPFVKEMTKLLERTIPEHIAVIFCHGGDEYVVSADPTRIQQVVMNLALNARDAMPESGELRFTLARVQVDDAKRAPLPDMAAGEWIRLTVEDKGTGIPPEALPHIFEPFYTTKPPGLGSGLGLAQVWGIVKQHEGHIDVVTELGKGTRFIVFLPALEESHPQPFDQTATAFIRGQGETVLIVEDDTALRQALVDTLELLNYRVVQAANGREALNLLEQDEEAIELVLSDLVMPEMGGEALFHAIRRRGLDKPVVIMSGHPMESELERLQEDGLADWLLKPPSQESLAEAIASALQE
jgi:CheY-like chemotaxis protein